MKRYALLGAFLFLNGSVFGEEPDLLAPYRSQSIEKWEETIQEFEERDRSESHPPSSVLFIGSSSIRLWDSIREDMTPYHPIQRGFGGSRISDLAVYADRLIHPHQFRAVVIFVANDIAGKDEDKTPEEVARLFSYFQRKIRGHNPSAPIFYIGVTPTEKRQSVWKEAQMSNNLIRLACESLKDTYFIGTESIFLDRAGNPRPEYFVDDQLHLNEAGYGLWAAAIKSHLDTVLGTAFVD